MKKEIKMKPYMVEIRTYGVVMAKNAEDARKVADEYLRDIFLEDASPYIEVNREIASLEDLDYGWDGECIPYNGDGNKRLKELLVSDDK